MSDGKYAWIIKDESYVVAAVKMIKHLLYEDNIGLKNDKNLHKGPLSHRYKPDMDVTDECDYENVSRFQQLIGVLQWAVELGRIYVK